MSCVLLHICHTAAGEANSDQSSDLMPTLDAARFRPSLQRKDVDTGREHQYAHLAQTMTADSIHLHYLRGCVSGPRFVAPPAVLMRGRVSRCTLNRKATIKSGSRACVINTYAALICLRQSFRPPGLCIIPHVVLQLDATTKVRNNRRTHWQFQVLVHLGRPQWRSNFSAPGRPSS